MPGNGYRDSGHDNPLLYGKLAEWWPLVSAPEEYAKEADFIKSIFTGASPRHKPALLEMGCGGGNTASHLKAHFTLTLSDRSPAMLAVSRALNPECEHIAGDMRSLRLGRLFDCVLIHDAVGYLSSMEDLRKALETCHLHCRPGGSTLLAPDYVRESFVTGVEHGGRDGHDQSLRYLDWTWDPDPDDTSYLSDFVFLLRLPDGSMRVEHDRHVFGLFNREDWMRLLREAGFEPRILRAPWGREVFLALKT